MRWRDPVPCVPDSAMIAACGDDPFLAAILMRRGFKDAQRIRAFLSPDEYIPAPPEQLPDLARAAQLLQDAIIEHVKILIWGDFDVDGQTATALLFDGLTRLGADVCFYVPSRTADSHGIKVSRLQEQITLHSPAILLTCDTGITEYAAVDYARSLGLTVIVTDHHEPGDRLPNANAVINPHRLIPGHPMSALPGVGVAYKLMQSLFIALGRGREVPRLLDLVALGIVGDVAEQSGDTRYLLQIGLERLRRTERVGLEALMEVARVAPVGLSADQIGYQLTPRLNSAGRLADAALAVELLTTHSGSRARILAAQLEGFNGERRAQTQIIDDAVNKMLEATPSLLDQPAIILYDPDWHPGVLGIIASRLADRYGRPAILLTGHDGMARGSARSAGGYDIGAALASLSDMLTTHGGHPGAAGLSLPIDQIDTFRERLCGVLSAMKTAEPPVVTLDAIVTLDQLTLDLAKRIYRLGPFGEGNPPVTLAALNLRLRRSAMMGYFQQHRRLTVQDEQGREQTILWWRGGRDMPPEGVFDAAFTVSFTEDQELQLALVDVRIHPGTAPEPRPTRHIEDWRAESDPAKIQALIDSLPDALVWGEVSRQQYPSFKRRAELTLADTLIVYTAPPDPQTFREAIERVQPKTVYLIGLPSPFPTVEAFLAQLRVAAKNVIAALDGKAAIDVLCGATAQSAATVRAGLDLLAAKGEISVTWRGKSTVQIAPSTSESQAEEVSNKQLRLTAAYHEVEAYRRYFRTAAADKLVGS